MERGFGRCAVKRETATGFRYKCVVVVLVGTHNFREAAIEVKPVWWAKTHCDQIQPTTVYSLIRFPANNNDKINTCWKQGKKRISKYPSFATFSAFSRKTRNIRKRPSNDKNTPCMSLRMSDLIVFLETPILRSARTAAVPGTISFHHLAAPQIKAFKLLVSVKRLGNRIKLIFVFVFK